MALYEYCKYLNLWASCVIGQLGAVIDFIWRMTRAKKCSGHGQTLKQLLDYAFLGLMGKIRKTSYFFEPNHCQLYLWIFGAKTNEFSLWAVAPPTSWLEPTPCAKFLSPNASLSSHVKKILIYFCVKIPSPFAIINENLWLIRESK